MMLLLLQRGIAIVVVEKMLLIIVIIATNFFLPANAILPPTNPPWPPTYNMTQSLITMQCNSSGFSSPKRASQFGIVSYDWSNAKKIWAETKPMNCEELLNDQARMAKQAGTSHVFTYRNIVKALPWFTTVRNKLDDPAYSGFFLKFDSTKSQSDYHVPACALENNTKCSMFYHDQEQTPQVPTKEHPHPDGSCLEYCDCGIHHPCGEYLFDHRNGTMLRDFIINEVILGALISDDSDDDDSKNMIVDGLFIDDYWCSNLLCDESSNKIAGCPCNDPIQGPTEIDKFSQYDMGLSDEDIAHITIEWNYTMTEIQHTLLGHNAYTWSLMYGQENANAKPILLQQSTCQQQLQEGCVNDVSDDDDDYGLSSLSIWQQYPRLFGFSVVNQTQLYQFQQDLAFYLLVRGNYTYAGWGKWGMTWPFNPEKRSGGLPPTPDGVPLPKELQLDYGVPLGLCYEEKSSPGVYTRKWSKATIELDCNTFQAKITTTTNNLIDNETQ